MTFTTVLFYILAAVLAVSYTHLDVYKRQVFHPLFTLQSSAGSNRANATILRFAHLTDA